MSIEVVMLVCVKPSEEARWRIAAKAFLTTARAAPGVLRYDLSQELDEERRFVWNATFADEAAMERHMDSEYIHAFAASAMDCVDLLPTIVTSRSVDLG